jgi:hypothetical protein
VRGRMGEGERGPVTKGKEAQDCRPTPLCHIPLDRTCLNSRRADDRGCARATIYAIKLGSAHGVMSSPRKPLQQSCDLRSVPAFTTARGSDATGIERRGNAVQACYPGRLQLGDDGRYVATSAARAAARASGS